jgi:hypothetical protein
MLEGLDQVDWGKIGQKPSPIPHWLCEFASDVEQIRRQAMGNLKDTLAPWELLDGYGSTTDLMRVIKRDEPYLVVPFLVELLTYESIQDKGFILEILYDLARYVDVGDDWVPLEEREMYKSRACRIFNAVYEGIYAYSDLLKDNAPEVRQGAEDLLNLLEEFRSTYKC